MRVLTLILMISMASEAHVFFSVGSTHSIDNNFNQSSIGYFISTSSTVIGDHKNQTGILNQSLKKNLVSDSDGDGIDDEDEINIYGTDVLSSDTDSDGINDYEEIFNTFTDPNLIDTDGDQISDYDELMIYLTSAINLDSDNDGLSDYSEIFVHLTNPNKVDSDSDGSSDLSEIKMGFSPLDASSSLDFRMHSISSNEFIISFMTATGHQYFVESCEVLSPTNWVRRMGLNGMGDRYIITDPEIDENRFYRIVVPDED